MFGVVADNLVCSNKDEECLLEIDIRSLCASLVVPAGDVLGFSFVHNGCQSVQKLSINIQGLYVMQSGIKLRKKMVEICQKWTKLEGTLKKWKFPSHQNVVILNNNKKN